LACQEGAVAVLSELIRHDKPKRYGATAVYPLTASLEKRYRFTSRFGDEVLLHSVDGKANEIHLPRALCPVGDTDLRQLGEPVVFPKGPTPRPHQVKIFKDLANVVTAEQSGLVVAGTGFGKTAIGCHLAYLIQRKTLVVVTKEDIYLQWLEAARNFLGLEDHEIGEIRGDKCEVIGTKFVIAMIQSLTKEDKYPDWIVDGFGLVLFDEVHRVAAEQFSRAAVMFPARFRFGLSATPERQDGKELLIYAHIGPVRAQAAIQLMVPKVLVFRSAWECPRVLRYDPDTGQQRVVRLPHAPGKTTHVEKMLAADPVRNHMVVELVKQAYDKGRKIVVFSTLHDHLKSMQRIAREAFKIPGREMGLYVGASTKIERERRDREMGRPILWTTYNMMGEGTDLPWLDTCVFAMPRSKIKQPLGRIRREYPDKNQPVAMDIVDADSPVFQGYANSRLRDYAEIGCVVKQID
jgi:superfamily II DNA or RNA helicase